MSETVTLEPGELPPPACYADEQERFNAYVAAIIATITGDNEVSIGPDAPSDTSLLWVKTNGPTGAPIAILTYSADDASWVRVAEIPTWGGITAGAGASYQIVNDPPYLTDAAAYVVGKTYRCIANHASVGASTFQVDSLSIKDIKIKGSDPVEADSIANNQVIDLTYDGVNMQLSFPNLTVNEIITVIGQLFYETGSSSYQSIPILGGSVVFAHGLGVRPFAFGVNFVCSDAGGDSDYSENDSVPSYGVQVINSTSDDQLTGVSADDTNVYFVNPLDNPSGNLFMLNKAGTRFTIDQTKWKLQAWALKASS